MMTDSREKPDHLPSTPKITAVVLNWNGGNVNKSCIDRLERCGYPRLEILFVDNGSTDGSGEMVREAYPRIGHLFTGRNLGFTGGNNLGIQEALRSGTDMVLILNNDVEVSEGFLEPLVATLKDRPGLVGPKILDPSGRLWCAGGMLAFHHNLTRLRGFGRMDNGRFDRLEPVDYLPACCLLVSREVFERIGLLEEEYFCYLEDVDFCARAREAGYPVLYCPDCRVIHRFSHSTGGGYSPARKYMNAVNSVRFLKAHGTIKSWLAFWILDFLALPPLIVIRLFQGRLRGVLAKGRGILVGLAGGRVTPESLTRYRPPKK